MEALIANTAAVIEEIMNKAVPNLLDSISNVSNKYPPSKE